MLRDRRRSIFVCSLRHFQAMECLRVLVSACQSFAPPTLVLY